ncbi:MAG TPA: histidine kinase dimerization/phosphoacceptor domain-containing protein, partial [Herpetosiphonaceae bacterium]|nr:histidine kinase dimerization/phosphoacceptor domain-containing protein [Herpetosiphonaceae bacterium]
MKLGSNYSAGRFIGWWQQRPWRADAASALVVGALAIAGAYGAELGRPGHRAIDAGALATLAAGAGALAFRRRYPARVLLFALGTALLYVLLGYPKGPNFLPLIIAFFAAATGGRRRIAWAVLAAEFVLFPWLPHLLGDEPAPTPAALLGLAGWLLVLAAIAELVHIRQQRRMRAREEAARIRAGEERLRIARELHDVLGHTISLINVQAGVALHLIDQQPEHARVALGVIKDASKDALRELRSVLDILRQVHEEPPRAPSAGLARLGDLVSRAAEAGVPVQTAI